MKEFLPFGPSLQLAIISLVILLITMNNWNLAPKYRHHREVVAFIVPYLVLWFYDSMILWFSFLSHESVVVDLFI